MAREERRTVATGMNHGEGTTSTAQGGGGPTSVYLLDDHELLRRGLREVLEEAGGFTVIGESGTASEAVRRIPALRPDVMLLDVQLPDGSGIDVCRQVLSIDPGIRALMVTTYDDDAARLCAVLAGAAGFVLKQIRGAELVRSVRRVAAGEVLLSREAAQAAVEAAAHPPVDPRLESLTGQERRILDLIADGLTNRQIGERLGITERTVKNYVTGLLLKLGLQRRTQAAVFRTRVGG